MIEQGKANEASAWGCIDLDDETIVYAAVMDGT